MKFAAFLKPLIDLMQKKFSIVMADDDIDDQDIMKQAFNDSKVLVTVNAVYDGVQLMDYLLKEGKYADKSIERPDLILLDLNMPLMDGFEALRQIKSHDHLKNIPVYVVTTSKSNFDITKTVELGAKGFYHKGASSKDIYRIVQEVCFECFS